MMTSTQPEAGKSSLKRVSRLKSLLAKAKSPVPTEQTSDAYPICQTDEDSQTDLDSQRMSVPDAPMVVSEDKPCACASQLSDCAGVGTNYVHMGTVLILTNDERMKMRLLLLITSRSFSCLIVNSLAEAQASMEREKFSAALLDLYDEQLESVASQLSWHHQMPIIARSSPCNDRRFTIPRVVDWLCRPEADVQLLEKLFMAVQSNYDAGKEPSLRRTS